MEELRHALRIPVAIILCAFFLSLALFHVPAARAAGATIVVNSTLDTDFGADGVCTLREAITAANYNVNYHECTGSNFGADTITFSVNGTISLAATLPIADESSLTIDGSGHSIFISGDTDGNGTGNVRVMMVNFGSTLTLLNVTILRGLASAPIDGGGIYTNGTLNVVNSTFTENKADRNGGGIYSAGGTVNITSSTFASNASGLGGCSSGAGYGGAVSMRAGTQSSITGSTFHSGSACSGGAIWNDGTMTVTNSTLSYNGASAFGGGAIRNDGNLTVNNSTFAGNNSDATHAGDGVIIGDGGLTTLKNTIMANTARWNCAHPGTGSLAADSYNIASDGSCGNSIIHTFADISLGLLAGNGGPTQTRALQEGSVAIDAGDPLVCGMVPVSGFDQRGAIRPQLAQCDVGAYEYAAIPYQTITFDALPDVSYGDGPLTLFATASSGLPVTFAVTGHCTNVGATLTLTGPGPCTVTASQSGNTFYGAAPVVVRSFLIYVEILLPLIRH